MTKEKTLLSAVLAFPVRPEEVLLAPKLQYIGAGRLNGYGGGIEEGETELEALVREIGQESGVSTLSADYEKVAIMDFHNTKSDGTSFVCRVHIYLLRRWDGEFQATKEMGLPAWYRKDRLPFDELMPADRYWLPLILDGRKLIGTAKYSPFQRELVGEIEMRFVDSFDGES